MVIFALFEGVASAIAVVASVISAGFLSVARPHPDVASIIFAGSGKRVSIVARIVADGAIIILAGAGTVACINPYGAPIIFAASLHGARTVPDGAMRILASRNVAAGTRAYGGIGVLANRVLRTIRNGATIVPDVAFGGFAHRL